MVIGNTALVVVPRVPAGMEGEKLEPARNGMRISCVDWYSRLTVKSGLFPFPARLSFWVDDVCHSAPSQCGLS